MVPGRLECQIILLFHALKSGLNCSWGVLHHAKNSVAIEAKAP